MNLQKQLNPTATKQRRTQPAFLLPFLILFIIFNLLIRCFDKKLLQHTQNMNLYIKVF